MRPLATSAALLLMCGCWGGKFIDMPGRVERMDAYRDTLETELDSLSSALDRNEAILRGIQAQSGSRTVELAEQLSELTAEMETIIRRLGSTGIQASGQDSVQRWEQVLFDEAFLQFQQRSYTTAAAGFLDLLSRNPASPLADDALYYAALCHEAMSQAHLAIEELVAMSYMFPASERTPAALSRAAAIYGAHGAGPDRERLLRRLIEEYPGSEEARLAEGVLQD